MEDGESSRTVNKKFLIQIPSYQEVVEGFANSSASASQSQSFFKPSQSFSQAFNFIKDSEFYSPPPPAATPSSVPSETVSVSQPEDATPNFSSNPNSTASSSLPVRGRRSILVSQRQKGNPVLKHIRNVKWEFSDIVCDYLLGQNSCALYLSVRYHLLHPDYIYYRIRELQKNYRLRVILCHVDVEDATKPLLEVTKTALLHDCTLLCAWSLEECGRYLETLKMYENKPADLIQGQMDTDYLSRLNHVLTSVRRVNKTDVVTLGSTFGSFASVMSASMEDLARCPGIGERKVRSLYDTFHEPFKRRVLKVAENGSSEKKDEDLETKDGSDKEGNDGTKRRKKETVLTVKSALSAAFAKHANKFNKGKNVLEGSSGDPAVNECEVDSS